MDFKKKSGFTLVELIVVIAIIGILAAIALPKMDKYIVEARAKANIATARTIYTSALAYNIDHMNDSTTNNNFLPNYLDQSTGTMVEYTDANGFPRTTWTYNSVLSQYLPDSVKFAMTTSDMALDNLYFITGFPMPTNFRQGNDLLAIYYYDPRMPVTSQDSGMLGNNNLTFSGTALVDGRAIVVCPGRFTNLEDMNNPTLYPTVEEYIQEYNDYMKNKETN